MAQDTTAVELAPFTGISIRSYANVFLSQASQQSVRTNTGEISSSSKFRVKDGVLEINGSNLDEIYVSMPVLNKLSISGKGKVNGLTPVTGDIIDIEISGDGKIGMELHVDKINADISGLGKITLSGSARQCDFDISGSGKVDALDLKTNVCHANISGLGKCNIDVTDELVINISGSGTVNYRTKPAKLEENISGIGKTSSYSGNANADTTHLTFGSTEVLIIDPKDDITICRKKETHPIWAGFEMGINSYVNSNGSFNLPAAYDALELRQEKSVSVSINPLQKNFELGKSNVWFFTGLGVTWNNYQFDKNVTLLPTTPVTTLVDTTSSIVYTKSKLVAVYLTAPVMFEVFSQRQKKNAFHFGVGALLGLRIGSHTKQKFELDGSTQKPKSYGDFNLNPFRYGVRAAIGYGGFNLFADYYASTLFKDQKGPTLYPVNIGITLVPF